MRKKFFIILMFTLCALMVIPSSCSRRYYTDHQGKITKGYNKPPKKWKQPGSRYLEQAKK